MASTSSQNRQAAVAVGPVEQLLDFNQKLFTLESEYIRARRYYFTRTFLVTFIFLGSFADYIATVSTYRHVDLAPVNRIVIPFILLSIAVLVAYLTYQDSLSEDRKYAPRRLYEVQLDIGILKEKRRLFSATLNLDLELRQFAYKDEIPAKLITLRREADYYRRVNNILQAIIIIGSLATSTLAGMGGTAAWHRWVTVGSSFSVGVAAGFVGYFKFKEKNFYLQQTADQVEQEVTAFDLRIDQYLQKEDAEALMLLSQRVEALVNEQRKRQQQLDQPTDNPSKQG
ncbi:hypothetical protein Caci_0714 [Catenulispora acidiphila DSM 44928]|uniref:Uncharacterized protein n=1 Tax=Catenulispora acidiphila (strain DSM 44928 / JCM 14897 / NBRC 102108 / NRRL B-24433 / ID139908) TaxID=479433 RepID=C7Q0M1_CATAD|nr:DUF4231 domain-containing protein [Catenulispora acidiphila]ACU69649.1 hypothetical protein Caci_0714 [Catenulispora acidiphila DSM 44928]